MNIEWHNTRSTAFVQIDTERHVDISCDGASINIHLVHKKHGTIAVLQVRETERRAVEIEQAAVEQFIVAIPALVAAYDAANGLKHQTDGLPSLVGDA